MNHVLVEPVANPLTAEKLFGELFDPAIWANPYPVYAKLREQGGLSLIDPHLWAVSSHSAVAAMLRHRSLSSDERRSTLNIDAEPGYHEAFNDSILFMDPPDHTRIRALMARAFSSRQARSWQPRAEAIVADLLLAFRIGDSFDLISDLARPLALRMISELLGVPYEDHPQFLSWGSKLARLLDPRVLRSLEQDAQATEAAASFRAYFGTLIETRRADPRDDLLSEMIAAQTSGDRLSPEELVAGAMVLLVAGFETTINLLGNGAVALVENPGQIDRLRQHPEMVSTAVDEMLRFDPPVQIAIRVATENLDLEGTTIEAGDTLIGFLGAANRDPLVFNAPEHFDIARTPNPHLAFGGGIHRCLGAALARVEAGAAFTGLLDTFPSLELAPDPPLKPTFTLRGYNTLVVTS